MHTLILHQLGPISHLEMTSNQFMVLTGCQASGKSTIAKALFFFRTIKDDIYTLLIRRVSGVSNYYELNKDSNLNDIENTIKYSNKNIFNNVNLKKQLLYLLREKFLSVFGSSLAMENGMFIEYHYSEENYVKISLKEATVDPTPNYIWIEWSQGIQMALEQFDQSLNKISFAIHDDEKLMIRNTLTAVFSDGYETLYIPAGRSMITLLATQLNYLYSTMDDAQKRTIDLCTRSYLENVIKLRPEFEDGLYGLRNNYPQKTQMMKKTLDLAEIISARILKGKYLYNSGNERLEIHEKQYVKINFTSSGQQESLWILNFLVYRLLQDVPTFFIIEEPESHLFPEAQKSMIEMISLVCGCGNSVLVTTHSPYVLGALNNLIFAGQLGEDAQNAADQIINRNLWINRENLSAWFVCDGGIQDCVDPETGMVRNELIDGISGVINRDFENLLDLHIKNERSE